MDFNAPMHALWSFFNPQSTTTVAPTQTQPTTTPSVPPVWNGPVAPTNPNQYRYSTKTGKPIADLPKEGEETVDVYPTIHSLEPTKLNEGKPWAGQKVPTGYLDGLAYAETKAKQVGGFEDETLKQFLPLGIRESRYNDYGNNGVWVDYKTPPPKELSGVIAQSNEAAARELRFKKLHADAVKNNRMQLADDLAAQELLAKRQKQEFEKTILANPNWTSRAESYKDITNKAQQLGLKQSTTQEIIRNKETGQLISKADVYRANEKDSYATKALHVPLALYNKMHENPNVKGVQLTKRFIGGGPEAEARSKQESEIYKNIYTHLKNKPVLDYYNTRLQHHSR